MDNKIRVLIVEHDPNDIELIQYELESSGINYESEVVQNEQDFVRALTNFIPDIVLSDYSLPSFDGPAAFKIKEKIAPDTPFIFVSGTIGEEKAVELIKSGVTDYALKDKLFALTPKIIRALRDAVEKKEKKTIDEKLHKANRLYAFISQVNQNIVRVKDEETLFNNSCSLALAYGKFKMAWIGLFDQLNEHITLVEQSGLPEHVLSLLSSLKIQEHGPQYYVLKRNTYYTCNDIEHEKELENWKPFAVKHGILSCLVLPVKKLGRTIGTFNLYSEEINFFNTEEIKLLVEITNDISFALDLFEKEKEHKKADELIVQNEKQKEFDKNNLNALINNTTDLMWSVDRDFNLITSNQPLDDIMVLMTGKVIAKGSNMLAAAFPAEQLKRFKNHYERALAGETFSEIEFTNIPVESWSEISYCPIQKGKEAIGAACHSRNITEIKRTEQYLKKSEAFNRGVLNSLKSHIAVVDVLGNIVAVNETWKRFAVENGETNLQRTGVGSNYYDVCVKSIKNGQEIATKALQGMKDIMEEKESFFSLEYPCHSPVKQRWFEMRVMKFDSDEQLIVVAHTDISELKMAEQELDNTLIELEHRVETRTKELFDKNKDILDSINYAKRIQVGLLSPSSLLNEIFPKSFILSLPRDIVSGDFFWCYKRHNKKFIVVADCTGHGVPGALMSIIGNNLLNNIIVNEHIENPSEILEQLDMRLKQAIKGGEEEVKDGMDIALCIVDTHFNELYFVGAYRPVFISDENGKIIELLPDRNTVGGGFMEDNKKFETKRFPIIPKQRIYLTSDGYVSQFGGVNNKKFMKSRFMKTLEEFQIQPIDQQKNILQNILIEWMGSNEQVDDVMVVGIEL